ncbi:MAG: Cyanophycin synthetase [uncultured bacterium]|nr:MAG: Cyanophycin synthetase [uncultured bacterium]
MPTKNKNIDWFECLEQDMVILTKTAQKNGLDVEVLMPKKSLIRLSLNGKSILIKATKFPTTSSVARSMADDKAVTYYFLKRAGIHIPKSKVVNSVEEGIKIADKIPSPWVIKPIVGSGGKNITAHIKNSEDIRNTLKNILANSEEAIIQNWIDGDDFRILIVNGKYAAALQRIPASITADGKHTIKKLIEIENKKDYRAKDYSKPLKTIYLDEEIKRKLEEAGLSLDSIPKKSDHIQLRFRANHALGGSTKDATDIVHPQTRKLSEKAAKILDLNFAGIDILAKDIKKPLDEKNGVINEVNATPLIYFHHLPTEGKSRDVASKIIEFLKEKAF